MDDREVVKLVERVVQLEARVAALEKRHSPREIIGQIRGLEQHALARLDKTEQHLQGLAARLERLSASGLLSQNFWTRTLTIGGYLLACCFLLLLCLLTLWGLLMMANLFLTPTILA